MLPLRNFGPKLIRHVLRSIYVLFNGLGAYMYIRVTVSWFGDAEVSDNLVVVLLDIYNIDLKPRISKAPGEVLPILPNMIELPKNPLTFTWCNNARIFKSSIVRKSKNGNLKECLPSRGEHPVQLPHGPAIV